MYMHGKALSDVPAIQLLRFQDSSKNSSHWGLPKFQQYKHVPTAISWANPNTPKQQQQKNKQTNQQTKQPNQTKPNQTKPNQTKPTNKQQQQHQHQHQHPPRQPPRQRPRPRRRRQQQQHFQSHPCSSAGLPFLTPQGQSGTSNGPFIEMICAAGSDPQTLRTHPLFKAFFSATQCFRGPCWSGAFPRPLVRSLSILFGLPSHKKQSITGSGFGSGLLLSPVKLLRSSGAQPFAIPKQGTAHAVPLGFFAISSKTSFSVMASHMEALERSSACPETRSTCQNQVDISTARWKGS